MHVRLIRSVLAPGGSGPTNGMYALQRALRQSAPCWLQVGGRLRGDELPWYWSWQDAPAAARCAVRGRPFVCGPNILFTDSRHPRATQAERAICRAAGCRLLFTESAWYRDLIARHLGPANHAPIVLWPYPIHPKPEGPLDRVEHDLLIYVKNGRFPGLAQKMTGRFPRSQLVRYGRYRRQELWRLARASGCCLYLADDDRGPLALAEILLSGCPVVGLPTGAPFIRPGHTGVILSAFTPDACRRAVETCHALNRNEVAAAARGQFDTDRIVQKVLSSLAVARG